MQDKEVDFIERYMSNNGLMYISDYIEIENNKKFNPRDISLYRVDEVCFDDKAPRKEALENVLASLRISGINFVFLIIGEKDRIGFYYGVSRDLSCKGNEDVNVFETGDSILKPSIEGNFRGSKVTEMEPKNRIEIFDKIQSMKYGRIIEGVPGANKNDEKFQGIDRLVDVMYGTPFAFMIIAKPLDLDSVIYLQKQLYDLYTNKLSSLAKMSVQTSQGFNDSSSETTTKSLSQSSNTSQTFSHGESISKTNGTSHTKTTGTSSTKTTGTSSTQTNGISSTQTNGTSGSKSTGTNSSNGKTTTDGTTSNSSGGKSTSHSGATSVTNGTNTTETTGVSASSTEGSSRSESNGSSRSESKGSSTSEAKGSSSSSTTGNTESRSESQGKTSSTTTGSSNSASTGRSSSSSTTVEVNNKEVQEWIKYLDEVLLPRLDYGKGKGLFLSSMAVFADTNGILDKLQNTIIALYSGENGNKVPLRATANTRLAKTMAKNFCLPFGKITAYNDKNDLSARTAMSQFIDRNAEISEGRGFLGNWITTNELGMIAGLPQKEIVGLALKEEVEFGLNANDNIKPENKIELGYLVQNGNVRKYNYVYLDKAVLDQHIFVSGVTGSGKTTTCQKILRKSNVPFLVIEPAKTEYRIMKKDYDDMLIFTIGDNNAAPLKMNPFVFYRHESITARVDMIKACIESAFDMEAAIPQIIESAIYKSYQDYGWNISTNRNSLFDDPFANGAEAFPTFDDLIKNAKIVVEEQGFDERLKNDYIGSINARLLGLLVGSKGFLLNTHQSVDFTDLLDKRVVFELEDIRSGSEKSLIMGFILINLSVAIKEKYLSEGKFKHITLVEEAHRLLSKYVPGDDPNKKHGVEMFSDMLAEIRKYGESLVIVDQIPNKLTPDVLKNTNTKIIHRIFAADDKEAIGNTVMLDDSQKKFLSNLPTGNAVFFSEGFNKAVQVKITKEYDTSEMSVPDNELISAVKEYYSENYEKDLIEGLSILKHKPSSEEYDCIKALSDGLAEEYTKRLGMAVKSADDVIPEKIRKDILNIECVLGREYLTEYISKYGLNVSADDFEHFKSDVSEMIGISLLDKEDKEYSLKRYVKYFKTK